MCSLTRGAAVCAGLGAVVPPGACSAPLRPPGVDLCGPPPAEDLLPTTSCSSRTSAVAISFGWGCRPRVFGSVRVSPDRLIAWSYSYEAGPTKSGLAVGTPKSFGHASWHVATADNVARRAMFRSLRQAPRRFRARGPHPNFAAFRCADSNPASMGHVRHTHSVLIGSSWG